MSQISPEYLRHAMRQWTTGVAIVTTQVGEQRHGMTVNSFTSLSLEPPLVTVTLAVGTRTQMMVEQSGHFGVTILNENQADISDRFAGRILESADRFAGLETFQISSGVPFLQGGLAFLDCRVVFSYSMQTSKMYIAEVTAIQPGKDGQPLVYHNRLYHRLEE